jgi:hypothetical protein
MLVHADVTSESSGCVIGSNPASTVVSNMDDVTLIDTQHPSPCDGEVTAWHICYYTSINEGGIYKATVNTWRRSNAEYVKVEGSCHNISRNMSSSDAPEPSLLCDSEPVLPFSVNTGDVVGVDLPSGLSLRILANNGSTQLLDPARSESFHNLSLHIYAVVNRKGRSSSVAVPVVSTMMVLAVLVTASVIALILWFWWKRRHSLVVKGKTIPSRVTSTGKCRYKYSLIREPVRISRFMEVIVHRQNCISCTESQNEDEKAMAICVLGMSKIHRERYWSFRLCRFLWQFSCMQP